MNNQRRREFLHRRRCEEIQHRRRECSWRRLSRMDVRLISRPETSTRLRTREEVDLLSLGELVLEPDEVLWEIDASRTEIGIGAALYQPAAWVYALDRLSPEYGHIHQRLRRLLAPNLLISDGVAPEVCADWPDPNAVFIADCGVRMRAVMDTARQRLLPGGRIVLNLTSPESLEIVRESLPNAWVMEIQIEANEYDNVAASTQFVLAWQYEDVKTFAFA